MRAAADPKQMTLCLSTETLETSLPTGTTAEPNSDMPASMPLQSDNSDDEMKVQARSRAVTHETGEVSTDSDAGSPDEQVCQENPVSAIASSATDDGIAGPFPNDKFIFDHSNTLKYKDHLNWLTNGACQPEEKDMPDGRFPRSSVEATKSRRASTRRFHSSYYFTCNSLAEPVKHPWLAYLFRGDYCYCHICWLFGDAQAQSSTWVTGMSDWQHLTRSIAAHLQSKQHRHCVSAYTTYAAGKSIDSEMAKLMLAEEQKWHHILTQQFDLLRLLTGLGLPLRGHRETADSDKPGIYLSLLHFLGNTDTILAQHLAGDNRIKYVSKTIVEEQIKVLASEVRSALIDECKAAKFYTVIVDSSPDISHKDQMAILLRYVAIDRDKRSVRVQERFTGYFQLVDGTALGICSVIERVLFQEFNLEAKYLTGQAYDGAAVMSGNRGGVQAVIKERLMRKGNTFVPYVHCPPHQLNLVLVHAAESGQPMPPVAVRQFFDVVQSVYNYFSCSYRRWHLLKSQSESESHGAEKGFPHIDDDSGTAYCQPTELREIDESKELVETTKGPLTLKSLSKTRWLARKDATSALLAHFGSVLESLALLIDDQHDADEVKQVYDLQHQLDWSFLLTLLWWNDILLIIDSASRLLQAKRNDLFMVVECFRNSAVRIEELRSDEKFKEYLKRTKEIWLSLGFSADEATFKQIRVRRKKRMADELLQDQVPVSQEDKYRTDVYFRVLDSMAGEIRSRGEGLHDVCELFGFLHPDHLSKINHSDAVHCVNKLRQHFPEYFTCELAAEIVAFQELYFNVNAASTANSSPISFLQFIVDNEPSDSFPEFEVLTCLFITLPIGISSAERSFSVLRRTKNYLHSTMKQERTSDLALLAIKRETAEQLDLNGIIKQFASNKVRRGSRLSH